MKVLITGGGGFLGYRLAQALLKKGTLADAAGAQAPITQITLFDMAFPENVDARLKCVKGDLTDQAGVEAAQAALLQAQPTASKETWQAFYRGWASLWADQVGVDTATERAATSAYPPARVRTNLPLMNQPQFGSAFACKAGTTMQPKTPPVRIWP